VLGAIVFDRAGGLRSAFLLQTAVNAVPLLLALLVVPLWLFASKQSSSCSANGQYIDSNAADPLQMLPTVHRDDSYSSSCIDMSNADMLAASPNQIGAGLKDVAAVGALPRKPSQPVQPTAAADSCEQLGAAADTADVCIEFSREDSADICQQRGIRRALHISSACDLESMRISATTAAKQDSADIEIRIDNDTKITASNQQQQQVPVVPDTPRSNNHNSLDIRSVLSTAADPVVFSQCLLVFLEALATGLVVVLVPAVMDVPTWLVGVIFIAMVSNVQIQWTLNTCYVLQCDYPAMQG
jgi:hypothetical protein